MAGCLISPVQEIGKCILTQCVWPPIKSHFDYWWCFDNNIQGLRTGIEELKEQKHYIEQKIEEARLHTHILRPGVAEWLKASTEKLEEAHKILLPDDNIPKAWNITFRYSMGKRAKETAEEIAEVRNDGNFNSIADPPLPPAMASPPPRSTTNFESRKGIEDEIIDSLKQSSVDVIGICGMGGVGKTTMAQRIEKRVKEENLFDEVVMVTVTQTMDMAKIQNEIAELLGLKFDVESIYARAHKLRTRLMDAKRKIIIFDDVWQSLRFEDLGIPIECNFERCKVLLTSRSRDTCKRIKNKMVFDLEILEAEEAWILFKENAGKCVEDSALRHLAKEVVKECKGLPIALVSLGIALQDVTSIYKWRHSLSQMRQSNPIDFPEVLTDVYKPLKLSYDYLENDGVRNIFLMCCLFPEDYDIPIDQLTWYNMGLRFGLQLFDDITNIEEPNITNIEEARNQTHTLVEKLKSRSLLIAGKDKLHVKMHDVVRDVAIYIGSRKNHGFLKSLHWFSIENSSDVNCKWMSMGISNEQMKVPVLSRFPKLRLLMLLELSYYGFYDISDISFEGMEDLNVLSFESISNGSLPPTLGSLENLQTLRLFRCEVENISVIGKLTSLKVLICCECVNITELPTEIERLKDLRLLELYRCRELQRIPFGIISSLFMLEELKIIRSFSKWERGGERRNASLKELEGLCNLTCLEIEISDFSLSAQEIRLSQKLVRYRIRIGIDEDYRFYDFETRDYEKVMLLDLSGAVGNWIQLLARNAESLTLEGDGSDNINLAEMEHLRKLEFGKCSRVKKLVDTSYLNQNVSSLCNLKSIYIWRCSNLKHLFPVSVAIRTRLLLQLEFLRIENCESLEQVFWNEGTNDNTDGCIEFPKLQELILENLPNLKAFCQGPENIDNTCFHFGCNPKDDSFWNLKSIYISECDNLRYLFSVSAARRCLLQLESLQIHLCESMEQVFWNEGTDDNTDGCIEFPKLKELRLDDLPNLTTFCQTEVSFWNFKSIYICRCHNLRYLFLVSAARRCLLQLENLQIHLCESMEQVFWNEGTDDNTDDCIEFPKLEELTLQNQPNLTAFCQMDISFWNLKYIDISQCDNLRYLFSVSAARRCLRQLENLQIHLCESMEQVFWNEGTDDNTDDCIEFPKLEELTLQNLPNLTAFCQTDVSFWNLKSIYISGCDNLRYLFSVSAPIRCLLQLEKLQIHFCESMEQVFWNEGTDDNTDDCIEFPKLEELTLQNLPNLTAFCQTDVSFWNLKSIDISGCHNLKYLFLVSAARRCFLQLENLEIQFCESMEQVCWNEGTDDNTDDCIEFPKLNKLTLKNLPNLTAFCQTDVSFGNLKSINIVGCRNLRSLFSARSCLLQLQFLQIYYCVSMEQVFWNEATDDNTDGCIEFPQLKKLLLYNLPNLTAFCQGLENISIKFPNLTNMEIMELPKLISLSLSPLNSETVENTCFHLFCNPKAEMGLLKDLRLYMFKDNIKNIWCHQMPNNFFNNIEILSINSMSGIKSLVSTSIAKNLVSLKSLDIDDCQEMVEVIEVDDDNDKQVVDINCLFPNLSHLELCNLDKLIRFWQWNHALELPLLEKMEIYNCRAMETFTLGSVNTPNIREIFINSRRSTMNHKDLNDVIHHMWAKSDDISETGG